MQISNEQYTIEVIKSNNNSLLAITFKGHHEQNEDSYAYKLGETNIFAIADGLGSAKYSGKGSSLATSIAIDRYIDHSLNINEIFDIWKEELLGEKLSNYETTLKLIKIKNRKIEISSVGDGGILYQLDNSGFSFLQDNLDFVNETNTLLSINSQDVVTKIDEKFIEEVDVLMFTDGIELVIEESMVKHFTAKLKEIYQESTIEEILGFIQEWVDSWLDKNIYDDATMIFCTCRSDLNDN